MTLNRLLPRSSFLLTLALGFALFTSCATALSASDDNVLKVGSPNTATADPPVRHPATNPCVVLLFSDFVFDNFNTQTFSYAPPASCPGPWGAVVFTADFYVTKGIQYDRTAEIEIGNVTIYFGTTPEPSPNLSPSWHVERDLTDYTALLEQAQSGAIELGNLVNNTYTGVIHGSAAIKFYPPCPGEHAPQTPDVVLAFPNLPGGAQQLVSTTSELTQTYTLPTNIERAYLDVFAQSQHADEFWYTCVPNDVTTELESCGNTAFRETEITIDGKPAGVAPVYPWIFTGGIDPFFWQPIPGVQTLNFVPFRVDLTPFAGVLADGHTHTLGISEYNADNYFNATATLFLYLDRGSKQVTGDVTQNTLSLAPSPNVKENLKTSGSNVSGTVTVSSSRSFTIAGYVNTSHGKVQTSVDQRIDFLNEQTFNIAGPKYVQDIAQFTYIVSKTSTREDGVTTDTNRTLLFPLFVDLSLISNPDGSFKQTGKIRQTYVDDITDSRNSAPVYASKLYNSVSTTDTLEVNSSGQISGNTSQRSAQDYFFSDSKALCYSRDLTAANNLLISITNGKGCPGGRNNY